MRHPPHRPLHQGAPVPLAPAPDTPSADLRVGYARCPTLTQELRSRLDALAEHGVPRDEPFSEETSTRVRMRPRFEAALAVLRRPDVFHAASAGAPSTGFRLYDTAHTERHPGLPQDDPEGCAADCLIGDAPGRAARCRRSTARRTTTRTPRTPCCRPSGAWFTEPAGRRLVKTSF